MGFGGNTRMMRMRTDTAFQRLWEESKMENSRSRGADFHVPWTRNEKWLWGEDNVWDYVQTERWEESLLENSPEEKLLYSKRGLWIRNLRKRSAC